MVGVVQREGGLAGEGSGERPGLVCIVHREALQRRVLAGLFSGSWGGIWQREECGLEDVYQRPRAV